MMGSRLLLSVMIAIFSIVDGLAQDYLFYGAYDGSQNLSSFGSTRKENYDVALHLTESDLVGMKVEGLRIPVSSLEGISRIKGWLTDALKVRNGVNVASIAEDSLDLTTVGNIDNGYVELRFAHPYTIPSQGVYVGYSLEISELNAFTGKPVLGVSGTNPEMSYMRSSKTYTSWKKRAVSLGFNSALQVLLTDGHANAATASLATKILQTNRPEPYTFNVLNKGYKGISSVDFTWKVEGKQGTVHQDLSVGPYYNKAQQVSFELPGLLTLGANTLTIEINKVNRVDNEMVSPASVDLKAYSLVPVHRPLVEEYTGTRCGWCPRGLVGMARMRKLYGDDFVGVSYHQYNETDPMDFGYVYSNRVTGFPIAYLDRDVETDPFLGFETLGFHFDKVWEIVRDEFVPVGIDLTASFVDEAQTEIEVRSFTTAAFDTTANYRLTYILTADSLSGTGAKWGQVNSLAGATSSYPDEDMKMYTEGADVVTGVEYSDVAIAWSEEPVEQVEYTANGSPRKIWIHNAGIEGSLPSQLVGGQPVEHTYRFNIANNKVVQRKDKLFAVVAVVDNDTRKIVNANFVPVQLYTTGIKDVQKDEAMTVSRRYYTIDGKQLTQPQKGINIVRTSDGHTFKVVVE